MTGQIVMHVVLYGFIMELRKDLCPRYHESRILTVFGVMT